MFARHEKVIKSLEVKLNIAKLTNITQKNTFRNLKILRFIIIHYLYTQKGKYNVFKNLKNDKNKVFYFK